MRSDTECNFRNESHTRVLAKLVFLDIGFSISEMRFDTENDLQKGSPTRILAKNVRILLLDLRKGFLRWIQFPKF